MTIPQSLTKQEALRQIAELQRHIDSLTKNNHPDKIEKGMLFRHKDGETYMVADTGRDDFRLLQVTRTEKDPFSGNLYSSEKLFGMITDTSDFEYLGHAKDLLTIKTDKPQVVVTDEMVERAVKSYWSFNGSLNQSWKHVLTLALNGKL